MRNAYIDAASSPSFWNGVIFIREKLNDAKSDSSDCSRNEKIIRLAHQIREDLINGCKLCDSDAFLRYTKMTSTNAYVTGKVIFQ